MFKIEKVDPGYWYECSFCNKTAVYEHDFQFACEEHKMELLFSAYNALAEEFPEE